MVAETAKRRTAAHAAAPSRKDCRSGPGQKWYWLRDTRRVVAAIAAVAVTVLLGCSAGGTASTDELPPGVQDPASVHTPAGALGLYHYVTITLPGPGLQDVLIVNGLLTDELALLPLPIGASVERTGLDSRTDLSSGPAVGSVYSNLHSLRADAREARHFLQAYAPDSSPALAGHMYAVEGYSELWLADLFCSGIPLSTIDFGGDYTLAAGSSTAEVYTHAAALFDSALAQLGDSARLQPFAAVGKGRALLALGRYAEAAAAVAGVPDDYTYQVFSGVRGGPFDPLSVGTQGAPSVADREGWNGLDYRASNDLRTATTLKPDGTYFPLKYEGSGTIPIALASGVEARLIAAEAALQANPDDGQWLAILNHLRQTAWSTIVPAPSGPLPDLSDPGGSGLSAARVDLLFRERAFWLFLTGHREGDLRRLIRQYGRTPETLYPTGAYPGGSGAYGAEIVAPVPASEEQYNPNYAGCINRNA